MQPSEQSSLSLSVRTYLQVIKRQRLLIFATAALAAALGALPAMTDDAVYESSASVRVSTLAGEGIFETSAEENGAAVAATRDLITEIEILHSAPVRAKVVETLDGSVEFEDPEIEVTPYSEIITITIRASDPTVAANVANAYATNFVEDRKERSTADLRLKTDELLAQAADAQSQLDSVNASLEDPTLAATDRTTLQSRQASLLAKVQDYQVRADQLSVEAALRGRGTQVVSPAEVELTPVSPSPAEGMAVGFVLGLLFGLGLAVVVDAVQDRIRSRDELAAVSGEVPVLAAVPNADFSQPDSDRTFLAQEAYRYLRSALRIYGLNTNLRSVVVTSATSGEGKTTTVANLARAMAAAGDRVVVVDADLRRPALHGAFKLRNDTGLSSLLAGEVSLGEAIRFVEPNLAVVTAGPPPDNPTELLGSAAFTTFLRAVDSQADFIIIDTPPVLPVADALIASQRVDGTIVVSRIGTVRRRSLRDLFRRLDEARVTLLGLVANDVEEESYDDYGSAYRLSEPTQAKSRSRLRRTGRRDATPADEPTKVG